MASKMVSTSVAGPENFMESYAEERLSVGAERMSRGREQQAGGGARAGVIHTLTMAVDGPTEGGVDILEKGLANVPCVCLKMPLY